MAYQDTFVFYQCNMDAPGMWSGFTYRWNDEAIAIRVRHCRNVLKYLNFYITCHGVLDAGTRRMHLGVAQSLPVLLQTGCDVLQNARNNQLLFLVRRIVIGCRSFSILIIPELNKGIILYLSMIRQPWQCNCFSAINSACTWEFSFATKCDSDLHTSYFINM